jgi:flagellar hook-associated protein 2
MAGINFIGSYSGMDQSVIDKLMAVEKRPLVQMTQKKSAMEAQKHAWKDVTTRLTNLLDKLAALSKTDTFFSKTITPSNPEKVSASGGQDAVAGNYDLKISQLATRTTVTGTHMTSMTPDDPLGLSGTLTLGVADQSSEIVIHETQSLRSVVRAINLEAGKTGVNATVVDGRMVLTSTAYGAKSLEISASDGAGGGPSALLEGLGLNAPEVKTGLKSHFEINGIAMIRDTNAIHDAVLGMSFQLKQTTTAEETLTITVGEDQGKAVQAFEAFVEQYNSTMSFLRTQTAAGSKELAGSQGKLYGENAIIRLQSGMRQLLTSNLEGSTSTFKHISELGLKTIDREGTLILDAEKLKKALSENPQQVQNFFSQTIKQEIEGVETNLKTGMADKIETLVKSFTDRTQGMIKTKNDSLDRALKDLSRRMEDFEMKLSKKEIYYLNLFSKLDVAMQKSEAQGNWLAAQLGGMQNK